MISHKICLADWDGTLREGYTAQDWLKFLAQFEVTDCYYSDLFENALKDYSHAKFSYETLVEICSEIYASALKGINKNEIEKIANEFMNILEDRLFVFSRELLNTLTKARYEIVIISGAPEEPLSPFFKAFPSCRIFGLKLETNKSGIFTGRILKNCGLKSIKKEIVNNILQKGMNAVLALGNAESDLPLLERANTAFFISDKPKHNLNQNFKYINHNESAEKIVRELEGVP